MFFESEKEGMENSGDARAIRPVHIQGISEGYYWVLAGLVYNQILIVELPPLFFVQGLRG